MNPAPAVRRGILPGSPAGHPDARHRASGCRPGRRLGHARRRGPFAARPAAAAAREGSPVADSVLHQVDGAVATITINRPAARNALTAETKVALLEALRDRQRRTRPSALCVLTGAGQAFCSGQDLREHAELLAAGGRRWTRSGRTTTRSSRRSPGCRSRSSPPCPAWPPGAGASLAFACDFRIAAERASLLLAFARVGLGADSGASWTLQRLIGAGQGGRAADAGRADRLGRRARTSAC